MSTHALGALVAATVIAGAAAGQQPPPRDQPAAMAGGTGVIAGRVVVMEVTPPPPIRRARVSLSGSALRVPEITDTDAEGNYRFTGLPAGAYRVTASKPGFVTLESGAARYAQRAAEIELKDAGAVRADVHLPRGAAIEGRITDSNAEPVPGLAVSASRFSYTASGRRTVAVKQTRTDDLGRYRLHSLPAGDYIVEAAPDPRIEATQAVISAADRPPGRGRTYFPGSPHVHEARRLTVTPGQEIRGTDFAIEAVPLARVSGRVITSTGTPAKAFGFRMVPVGGGAGVSGSLTGEGQFHLGHVPPGDYLMLASVSAVGNAVAESAVQRVSVNGQDIGDVTVVTAPGAVLGGQVQATGEVTIPNLRGVLLEAIETDFEMSPSRPPAPPVAVQDDGRFAVSGLFGPRILRLNGLPSGWALESVRLGDADITDTAIDFRGSNAPRQLRMMITDQTGTVTGNVRARNAHVRAYEVIVIPEDETRRSPTSRFIYRTSPRADGSFSLSGLLPGRYRITATDFLPDGSWNDPDVLRRLAAAGAAVTVSSRDARSLTLELQVSR